MIKALITPRLALGPILSHPGLKTLAKIYGFTDLDGSQPAASRYVVEVQDAGKPAEVTGYRQTK